MGEGELNMKKRLLVLSFDALAGKDFNLMAEMPEFKEFLAEASYSTQVSAVYPSVTYPCHTSIITGKYPKNHGVMSNTLLQAGRLDSPDWHWQRKSIKTETLYDLAIDQNMTVAAFLWPVTGKSRIQYNVPEIFPNRAWDHQLLVSMRNGSPRFLVELFGKYAHLLNGIKQPNLDDFVTEAAIHTLKTRKPDLMLVHWTDLDTARHDHGVDSPEGTAAIHRLGGRFAKIVQTLKDEGLYEETILVVLGDHSQLDFHTKVPLNQRLKERGWVSLKGNKVVSWQVLAKSNGGSAYIYRRGQGPSDGELRHFLEEMQQDPANGIEVIRDAEEAAGEGADPECAFLLEAAEGYVFTDTLGGGEKGFKADHGYHPTEKKGYETFFAARGPGIKKGANAGPMSLVDHGPTWAQLLGLKLKNPDGRILEEILEGDL